jgi:hypothetical protein
MAQLDIKYLAKHAIKKVHLNNEKQEAKCPIDQDNSLKSIIGSSKLRKEKRHEYEIGSFLASSEHKSS